MFFSEPVFIRGNICFNNAPFARKCINCFKNIGPKSVHQITNDGCKECKIHVHAYYHDTGNCVNINCLDKLSQEYMDKLTYEGRQMMFAPKSRIEDMRKNNILD